MFLILLIQKGGVLENYLPIVVFIFLGIAFGIVPMLIGYWLGPSKLNHCPWKHESNFQIK
jgi:NADH-quinone oxidoreductase subunit A